MSTTLPVARSESGDAERRRSAAPIVVLSEMFAAVYTAEICARMLLKPGTALSAMESGASVRTQDRGIRSKHAYQPLRCRQSFA
jgi:hypothetical protein